MRAFTTKSKDGYHELRRQSALLSSVRWTYSGRTSPAYQTARTDTVAAVITQLESGRIDPRLSTVRSIARALKVKPWVLVADVSDNTEFWRRYLSLTAVQKRELQRHIEWMLR